MSDVVFFPGDFPAVRAHFEAAAEIWQAFADGTISSSRREALLAPLRAGLARVETPSVPRQLHR